MKKTTTTKNQTGAIMEKIEIKGNQVRYRFETDHERSALLANGFKDDPSEEYVMCSTGKHAKGIAEIIKSGGSSGTIMSHL
jgi:hypothetical protein